MSQRFAEEHPEFTGHLRGNDCVKVSIVDFGESRTRQSEQDRCDINKILERFEVTGEMPVDTREALYLDVADAPDYRTALDQVRVANEYFMSLPAKVRAEFENDAAVFLDELHDEKNHERFQELGVLPKSGTEVTPTGENKETESPPEPEA